jgi:hypothetical protein
MGEVSDRLGHLEIKFERNGRNVRTRTVSPRLLDIAWHTHQHRLATATETHNAMTDCGDDGWGA